MDFRVATARIGAALPVINRARPRETRVWASGIDLTAGVSFRMMI
jgi:hypothetical protein